MKIWTTQTNTQVCLVLLLLKYSKVEEKMTVIYDAN